MMQPNLQEADAEQALPMSAFIFEKPQTIRMEAPLLVGVLEGEGIGPEVIGVALRLLHALEGICGLKFDLCFGGAIGVQAKTQNGKPLPEEIITFCRNVFSQGGAILNGPGGDRYVYDLRVQFDLFCKLSPLRVSPELANAGRMKPDFVRDVDILLVRENVSGFYQGQWSESATESDGIQAEQSCLYTEKQVRRIVQVAAHTAKTRRGKLSVVVKDGGVPTISKLWRDCAVQIAQQADIEYSILNIDYAAYKLIQHPHEFDVIVAPNLFGDVLGDLGSVLLGSRGLSFSGNFAANGAAVYQTNHGSAYDLVGKNEANPVGQIYSMAMMLRESFGLANEARLLEDAVAQVWQRGWRTADLAEEGCKVVGTREMGDLICDALIELSSSLVGNRAL
ncbi:MAG TPA: isocitrate/isopropylmalate family dehydrogenase [Abditibacteriaceae bacterium]|jgi:3-isopropylmalate dehydrogenase|nr:isocitrate/isopropylmalate family dehydrogenase [Abditibacteriaceae bacterium]